jgi:hypothetical protein
MVQLGCTFILLRHLRDRFWGVAFACKLSQGFV